MKKSQPKDKKVLNKIITVLSILLAVVVIGNIGYFSYLYFGQKAAEKELAQAVETAVAECEATLADFGITETQEEYMALYKQNMEECKTTFQKAYIANAMLTYAANSANLENSNNITEIYNSGTMGQSKDYLVQDLNNARNKLQAAIYKYTVYNED